MSQPNGLNLSSKAQISTAKSSKGTPDLDIMINMNFLINLHLYTHNKMI